ncbi:hypothetical protein [Pseudomonas mediterranea]|jgi:ZIP family zinc transporter|uniref:Zinc transporter, ZIP family n=1 Tax=Pseudomonas mediterranea TaxID=183795 RepID=A0AAX2DJP7_9PSED|nr:hypothetical protein SRABI112_02856 [Pseudomonas mediterranea]SDU76089.1 zinc transporter, ZIP family [Pseudomonas mediterranea]
MDIETLAPRSGRMFRYALGSLLLLAGMTLLAAEGLAWLGLEPRLLHALHRGWWSHCSRCCAPGW